MKAPAVSSVKIKVPARIVLRPNRSLSHASAVRYFLGIAVTGAVLALLCWRFGAWPVVPYLALELAGIGFVLWLLRRRAHDREVITLDDHRLRIERHEGARTITHEFQRYWAHIEIKPMRRGWHPSRLLIRSHGREVEVGIELTEEERLALARSLKQVVGHGYQPAEMAMTAWGQEIDRRRARTPTHSSGAFDISRFKPL